MNNTILLIAACFAVGGICFAAETNSAQGMRPYPEDRMILSWMRQDRHEVSDVIATDDPSSREPNLDVSDCFAVRCLRPVLVVRRHEHLPLARTGSFSAARPSITRTTSSLRSSTTAASSTRAGNTTTATPRRGRFAPS